MTRVIGHVDMDAFFASVEQRDNPALRGKPVLVGGDGGRGVVAAASYEARAFGVHSAMPMAIAKRRCPTAIVVTPRSEAYSKASECFMTVLEQFSPLVEPISVDEAFIDLSGTERLWGTGRTAADMIRARVAQATGLTCSIGIAQNKLIAKMASTEAKPDGVFIVPAQRSTAFLDSLGIERLWGIGPKTKQALLSRGVRTIGQLRAMPVSLLAAQLGSQTASKVLRRASGLDDRPVESRGTRLSVSCENTYNRDLTTRTQVHERLLAQAEELVYRMHAKSYRGRTVVLKIRYDDFSTLTRRSTVAEPICDAVSIYKLAKTMLEELSVGQRQGSRVRLTGLGITNLGQANQGTLAFDDPDKDPEIVDQTINVLRQKYGSVVIKRAATLKPSDN